MKKLLPCLITALLFLLFASTNVMACTQINIKAADNTVMIGRTLEFGPDLKSNIITSAIGREFTTKTADGSLGLSWKAKYGYLYLDYFNTNHPLDGMNQQGLSFGFLYMPNYTEYPQLSQQDIKRSLPMYHLGDWILSNFSNIAEVKEALKNIVIYNKSETIEGHDNVSFPLHAIVTDANNNSIVLEFSNGKTMVYDNPLGILTNAPSFPWQLNNLKNYANLSPYSPAPIKVDGYTYTGTGQGSGMVGLPGDTTPPSRFVKASMLTQTASPVNNANEALTLSKHILNTVDIPKGMVRAEKGKNGDMETTQWTVYKDLKNKILYFTSYNNSNLQMIDMNKLNFKEGAPQSKLPIVSKQQIIDASNKLKS